MIESGRPKRRVVVTVNISGAEGPRTHIWLYHTNHQPAFIMMMMMGIMYIILIYLYSFVYLALSHQPPASFYHDDDDYVLYLSCEYIYLYIWLYRTNHQSAVILMMIGIIYYVYYIDILIFIWLYHTKHQSALILMMMTGIMYYVCYIDILIFIYIIGAITPSTSQHDDDNQYIMRLRTNSVCLSPNKVIRALFNTNTPPKTPI